MCYIVSIQKLVCRKKVSSTSLSLEPLPLVLMDKIFFNQTPMAGNAARKFEGQKGPEDEHIEELDMEDLEVIEEVDEGDVSHEATGPTAEKRSEWQNMDHVRGEVSNFSKDVEISFDMQLDRDKRTEDEPGEDMFLIDKTNGIAGVLDGLGGEGEAGSGARASSVAAEEFPAAYAKARIDALAAIRNPSERDALVAEFMNGLASREHPSNREAMKEALKARNLPADVQIEAIAMRKALKEINPKVQETGGKTTATLGKTIETSDGRHYEVIANMGDGGAFKMKADGSIEDLTTEDSAVNWLVENGVITAEQASDPDYEVKKGQRVRDLRKVNTRALGMKDEPGLSFEPEIVVTELEPGDKIVYVTDGLRDIDIFRTDEQFDPQKAAEYIAKAGGAENLASILNDAAVSRESEIKKSGEKAKMDEKTVLVKERLASAEGLELVDDEDILELDDSDLQEVA